MYSRAFRIEESNKQQIIDIGRAAGSTNLGCNSPVMVICSEVSAHKQLYVLSRPLCQTTSQTFALSLFQMSHLQSHLQSQLQLHLQSQLQLLGLQII